MLSSVGFSGVYSPFVSPWLYGVNNPRFVAVHIPDFFDVFHLFGLVLLL